MKLISPEFVQNIIEKSDPNASRVVLKSFDVKNGAVAGENFCSEILQVDAEYVRYNEDSQSIDVEKSFIVKLSLNEGAIEAISEEVQYFPREIKIYQDILPQVKKLLDAIGVNSSFTPKCLDCDQSRGFLVFEDLKPLDYKGVNKRFGLDFNHLKVTISALTKWHAATAVIFAHNNFPEIFRSQYREGKPFVDTFFTNISKSLGSLTRSWAGFEEISAKLSSISMNGIKRQYPMYEPNDREIFVLSHSDMWTNNLFYKYDNDHNVADVMLIDFALSVVSPLTVDLFTLLYGSADAKVTECEMDRLIQFYHSELSRNLRLLNYDRAIPSLTDIHVSLLRTGFHFVLISMYIIGLRHIRKPNDNIFGTFLETNDENESVRVDFFSDEKCVDELRHRLLFFDRKGFLDHFN